MYNPALWNRLCSAKYLEPHGNSVENWDVLSVKSKNFCQLTIFKEFTILSWLLKWILRYESKFAVKRQSFWYIICPHRLTLRYSRSWRWSFSYGLQKFKTCDNFIKLKLTIWIWEYYSKLLQVNLSNFIFRYFISIFYQWYERNKSEVLTFT